MFKSWKRKTHSDAGALQTHEVGCCFQDNWQLNLTRASDQMKQGWVETVIGSAHNGAA